MGVDMFAEERDVFQQRIKGYQTQIEDLHDHIFAQGKENSKLKSNVVDKQQEIRILKLNTEDQEHTIKEVELELQQIKDEYRSSASTIKRKTTICQDLDSKVQELQFTISSSKSKVEYAQSALENKRVKKKAYKEKVQKLEVIIEEMRNSSQSQRDNRDADLEAAELDRIALAELRVKYDDAMEKLNSGMVR